MIQQPEVISEWSRQLHGCVRAVTGTVWFGIYRFTSPLVLSAHGTSRLWWIHVHPYSVSRLVTQERGCIWISSGHSCRVAMATGMCWWWWISSLVGSNFKRSVYKMRRQWLMRFSRAILSGLVCHWSSIPTRAETFMGIFSKLSVSCWMVWRPRSRHIDQVRTGRWRDTTSKCWISCIVSCKASNDVGMNTCQYWVWLCDRQSIAAQDLLRTCCSWGGKWICLRMSFWIPHRLSSCLEHRLSTCRRCCLGCKKCSIKPVNICGRHS